MSSNKDSKKKPRGIKRARAKNEEAEEEYQVALEEYGNPVDDAICLLKQAESANGKLIITEWSWK